MANVIKLKNSGTASNVPAAANLQYGEIAINYNDGRLFYKNPSNAVITTRLITSISGTTDQITVSEATGAFTLSLPTNVKVTSLFVDNIEIDTTGALSNQALVFNGTKFAPANVSSSGAIIYSQDAAPTYLEDALWYETDTGKLFIAYDSYWVQLASAGPQGEAGQGVPTGGATGQLLSKSSSTNYDTAWTNPPAKVINTDGNPGYTIYVGSIDPTVSYSPATGDVWIQPA